MIETPTGTLGGVFNMLAQSARQTYDPGFESEPAYPDVPFHSRESLEQGVALGVGLFRDVRDAVLQSELELRA